MHIITFMDCLFLFSYFVCSPYLRALTSVKIWFFWQWSIILWSRQKWLFCRKGPDDWASAEKEYFLEICVEFRYECGPVLYMQQHSSTTKTLQCNFWGIRCFLQNLHHQSQQYHSLSQHVVLYGSLFSTNYVSWSFRIRRSRSYLYL